jgi:O-antigen biosynthesis protein
MRVRGKTVLDRNKQSQANICIVTRSLDCDDLFNEPSLSMTALAQRLALAGYPITLLWIPRNPPDEKKTREFQEYYRSRYGIEVEKFKHSDQLIWQFSNAQYFSFGAWSYIRPQKFSDVFFPLEEGLAYYSLLAKETGVFEPASANIHVVASVPIEWCSQADRFFFRSMEQIRNSFMEKYCAEQADRLICLSTDLYQWMISKGWEIKDASSSVLPSLVPLDWEGDVEPIEPAADRNGIELVALIGSRFRDGITPL